MSAQGDRGRDPHVPHANASNVKTVPPAEGAMKTSLFKGRMAGWGKHTLDPNASKAMERNEGGASAPHTFFFFRALSRTRKSMRAGRAPRRAADVKNHSTRCLDAHEIASGAYPHDQ